MCDIICRDSASEIQASLRRDLTVGKSQAKNMKDEERMTGTYYQMSAQFYLINMKQFSQKSKPLHCSTSVLFCSLDCVLQQW
jgi:hypothetical protein